MMTEASPAFHTRAQLAAIAGVRWRMFVNSLHTTRATLELISRIMVGFAFFIGGIGGAFGMAAGAFLLLSQGKPEMLALLLWPVFIFWQVFPVMATAFTNNPDSSDLLRFPLNYRSFFLIRLAYGFFDPASALGTVALVGVLFGITIARPLLFPWALLTLFVFAIFNLMLMQAIFAWLERWLAQRRTREVMGVLFILVMLSFQLIGPMTQRLGRRPNPQFRHILEVAAQAQTVLPPGLT